MEDDPVIEWLKRIDQKVDFLLKEVSKHSAYFKILAGALGLVIPSLLYLLYLLAQGI